VLDDTDSGKVLTITLTKEENETPKNEDENDEDGNWTDTWSQLLEYDQGGLTSTEEVKGNAK
jgi:hypothetical protein